MGFGVWNQSAKSNGAGMTLVEVMVATAVISILGLILAGVMLSMAKGLVEAREQSRAHRLAKTLHIQVESMPLRNIFACDSRLPDFGLTSVSLGGLHSAPFRTATTNPFSFYPSSRTLLAIQQEVLSSGFSNFSLEVTFLRRDRSAMRTAGVTSNVIPFLDIDSSIIPIPPSSLSAYTRGDGYDDHDPMLRYLDLNSDGDYYDHFNLLKYSAAVALPTGCVWISWLGANSMGCPFGVTFPPDPTPGFPRRFSRESLTEMPDTRLKQIRLILWNKKGEIVHKEGWVMSEKGMSGAKSDDWESTVFLDVTQPLARTILFASTSTHQQDAQSLPITKAYPAGNVTLQADSSLDLEIRGETAPLADLMFSTTPAFVAGVFSPMDVGVSDVNGVFSLPVANITSELREGRNRVGGLVQKGGFRSPFWITDLIYDVRPPLLLSTTPVNNTNPIRTRSPFVGVRLIDDISGTTDVSGIEREVVFVSTKDGGGGGFDPAHFIFRNGWANYGDDWVVVASTTSGLIEPLPDNQWIHVDVEAGDRAGYKLTTRWKFKINTMNSDSSTPTIKVPCSVPGGCADGCSVTVAGGIPTIVCLLNDFESGIDWRTIQLTVNPGTTTMPPFIANVRLPNTPRMGDYFNPMTIQTGGTLTYRFPQSLPTGLYTYSVSVSNYKGLNSQLPEKFFNVP